MVLLSSLGICPPSVSPPPWGVIEPLAAQGAQHGPWHLGDPQSLSVDLSISFLPGRSVQVLARPLLLPQGAPAVLSLKK